MVKGHIVTDFSKFSKEKQLQAAIFLIAIYNEDNKKLNFSKEGVQPITIGDRLFLTNAQQRLACMNGEEVDLWVFCPGCRKEGLATLMDFKKGLCGACRKEKL